MYKVTRQEAVEAGHTKMPLLKVIRAKCLDCSAGNTAEVRRCVCTGCALWPFRMGNNPFTSRKGNPAAIEAMRRALQQGGDDEASPPVDEAG